MEAKRTPYHVGIFDSDYHDPEDMQVLDDYHSRFLPQNATSSRVDDDPEIHMPCIDIDLPCRLVESRTPGHFHLYIDTTISYEMYDNMLQAMVLAGIVEDGYYQAFTRRRATILRVQREDGTWP